MKDESASCTALMFAVRDSEDLHMLELVMGGILMLDNGSSLQYSSNGWALADVAYPTLQSNSQ